ncbi:hypothetical protein I6G78_16800 [Burkholderia glumae]|uniref:Lipoprotein n=2 Tax=Burkholderia glumae TaxID=337 RepID=A0AAP9Y5Y8_BURGL|nr:putative lipoprotein [Burkholderia glumae LMG 2196 = ATCC 33617]PJO21055.1 hypothetical protein Y5A_021545 [Burkholderia glumae AU6208]PNL02115.1 hypothetical protein CEQ24_024665 [Burkholderia glumae]QHE09613.1 hypothetical protein GQR88_03910 [Burkholderia glumae AU6208]QKM53954.1 hypothetical protein CG017_01981 [Burkholderia glumae]
MQAMTTKTARICAIWLAVAMSTSGCTSFRPVGQAPDGTEANHAVHSVCSRFVIDPGRDLKVGDEIRYQACDGTAGSMKVETIGAQAIGGGGGQIDLRELREMEVKSVSVGRTVLFGVGVSAAVVAAAVVIVGATFAAAILGAQ